MHEAEEIRLCSNVNFSEALEKGQYHQTKQVAISSLEWILRMAEFDRPPSQQGAHTTVVCRIELCTIAGPILHLSTFFVGANSGVSACAEHF